MEQDEIDEMIWEGTPPLTAAKFKQLFGFELSIENELMGPEVVDTMNTIVRKDFGPPEREFAPCLCPVFNGRVNRGRKCFDRRCMLWSNYIECPPECGDRCMNNCFREYRWKTKLRLVHMQGKGFCLITKEVIRKGDMILEYTGQVYVKSQNPFDGISMYSCEFKMSPRAAELIKEELVIEPTVKGGWGRYLSHSCDPCCKLDTFCSQGKLKNVLIAKRDIAINEELTWHYGVSFLSMGIEHCHCGTTKCPHRYKILEMPLIPVTIEQPGPSSALRLVNPPCTPPHASTPLPPSIRRCQAVTRRPSRPSPRKYPLSYDSEVTPTQTPEKMPAWPPSSPQLRTTPPQMPTPPQFSSRLSPVAGDHRRTRIEFDNAQCDPEHDLPDENMDRTCFGNPSPEFSAASNTPAPLSQFPFDHGQHIQPIPLVVGSPSPSHQNRQPSPRSSPDCTPPPFCVSPQEPTAIRVQPRARIDLRRSPCSPDQPSSVDEGCIRDPRGPSPAVFGGSPPSTTPCSPQQPIRSSPVEPGSACQPRQNKQPSSRLSPDICFPPPCSGPAQPPPVLRNAPKIRIQSRAIGRNMPISAEEIASLPTNNRPRTSPADEPCQRRPVTRPVTSPRQGEPMDFDDDGKQQQQQPSKKGKRKRESEGLTGNARRRQRQDIVNEDELNPEAVSSYEEVTTTRRVLRSTKTIEPQLKNLPKANPPKSKAVTKAKTASKPSAPPSTTTTVSEETTSTTTRIRVRVIGNADPIIPSRIAPVIPKPKRGRPVENPGPFTCKIDKCGKVFDDFGHFNEHQQGVHAKGGKWKCPEPECGWECNSKRYLDRHMEKHKEDSERTWYECPTCENSKKYSRPAGVTKHQKSKKNDCQIQKAIKREPKRASANEEDEDESEEDEGSAESEE